MIAICIGTVGVVLYTFFFGLGLLIQLNMPKKLIQWIKPST